MSETEQPESKKDDPPQPAARPDDAVVVTDSTDAGPAKSAADQPLVEPDTSATHFIFRNRAFHIPECYFELHAADKQPAFFLSLNEVKLSILVSRLTVDFGLDAQSEDARMLGLVSAGLNYVKRIHPGDSIPNELLDGSASWSVSEENLTLGRGRVILAVGRFAHDPEAIDVDYVTQMLDDTNTERRIETELAAIIRESDKPNLTTIDLREELHAAGREAAYIEALLESIQKVGKIRDYVISIRSRYGRELVMLESVGRIIALFEKPMKHLMGLRASYFKLIANTRNLLISEGGTLVPLREVRDQLRFEVMRWEEQVAMWAEIDNEARSTIDPALRKLYVFVARQFPVGEPWPLMYGRGRAKRRPKKFRI